MKTNRRFLLVAILALALAFAFGCSEDSNPNGPVGPVGPGGGTGPVTGPGAWTIVPSPFGMDVIKGIAYGNGKFIAYVGASAEPKGCKIATSPDGATWTEVADLSNMLKLPDRLNASIESIAYGGGKFIVGGQGKIAYSTDGITWTAVDVSNIFTYSIESITYGNGMFVAGGSFGEIATSTDGITWTAAENSTLEHVIKAIVFGNGRFVAASTQNGQGWGGKMATSTNGVTWTAAGNSTFTTSDGLHALAFGNGKFVAGGADWRPDDKMSISTDGTTWTVVAIPPFGVSGFTTAIVFANGKFVAGDLHGNIRISTDGINWTSAGEYVLGKDSYGYGYGMDGIVYGGGTFVAWCSEDNIIAYSKDGGSSPVTPSSSSRGNTTLPSSSSNGGSSSSSGGSAVFSINGTWEGDDGSEITFTGNNNGSFVYTEDNITAMKGTYTVSGSTITTTVTELHGNVLNEQFSEDDDLIFDGNKWYNRNQTVDALRKWAKGLGLTDGQISEFLDIMSDYLDGFFTTETAKINSNNTITDSEGTVYTKTAGN